MMSLAARKGKGWMLIEVERRRNVPSMIAVYTTGLTRPLNSVLIFIFISLGQLSSYVRAGFSIFILDLAVSLRTSTPDQHRAVTGEVESEAAFSRHGAIVVPSCHGTGRGREKPLRFLPGPPCPAGTT